ncbi:MAG TPA: DUF4188 domain-containing protein [Rhodopila sp.]
MEPKISRRSVDLTGYPDLVVIYLGMRVNALRGIAAFLGIAPKLAAISKHKPDGLLAHETIVFGLRHVGFRQYWHNFESLERFTRSEPHRTWWRGFLKDNRGTGFWHETYRLKGGMEAIYLHMPPVGLASFAPALSPEGRHMSACGRITA